jgi:serine/threonine protein kinase
MESGMQDFLKEATIMHTLDHDYIVRLYGVVLGTQSLMLVSRFI